MTPTTRALCVRRLSDQSARFFRLMDREITHDEKFFQFLLIDFLCHIGIRMQNYAGFESVADEFLLTRSIACPITPRNLKSPATWSLASLFRSCGRGNSCK